MNGFYLGFSSTYHVDSLGIFNTVLIEKVNYFIDHSIKYNISQEDNNNRMCQLIHS